MWNKFWIWYESHLTFHTAFAAALFILQLIHLYWLTTHVVTQRLIGVDLFNPPFFWQWIIIVVDYTEIPALFTTSLVYINEQRKRARFKNLLFLTFLNIQFLHIFWITDEFVIDQFTGKVDTILPVWLAWVAIFIDYLELPVILAVFKKTTSDILHKLK